MIKDINKQIEEEAKNIAKRIVVIENRDKFSSETDMRVAEYCLYKAIKEQRESSSWRKVSEELPSNEYKNEVMPQTLCLTKSKRYGIKLLAYNHSYDVWDDEYLDDYVCDRDDIEEWKPID